MSSDGSNSDGLKTDPALRRPGTAGRRVGYAVAILVNAGLLFAINVWPGWEIVTFLTDDVPRVLGLLNASLVVGIVVNVVNLLLDRVAVRALGDIVTLSVGIAVLVLIWQVFPFDFPQGAIDWDLIFALLLALAIVGSVIGLIVQLVTLIRAAAGLGPAEPDGPA